MAKGQRYVCCCDSAVWCQVIYWVQGIWGVLTIIANAALMWLVISIISLVETELGAQKVKSSGLRGYEIFVIVLLSLNILVGVAHIVLAIILFGALQQRSDKKLKTWVIGSIVVLVWDTVDFFGLISIPYSVAGDDSLSICIWILKLLAEIFAIWLVDSHRKEMLFNAGQGQFQYQDQGAVPVINGASQNMLLVPIPYTGVVEVENPSAAPGTAQNS